MGFVSCNLCLQLIPATYKKHLLGLLQPMKQLNVRTRKNENHCSEHEILHWRIEKIFLVFEGYKIVLLLLVAIHTKVSKKIFEIREKSHICKHNSTHCLSFLFFISPQ